MKKLVEVLQKYNINEQIEHSKSFEYLHKTIDALEKLDKVLLLACSNRYQFDDNIDTPKSTLLAMAMKEILGDKAVLIDVPELTIHPCEGNVSRKDGNSCGLKDAMLKSKTKNPSGHHRCWASINQKDDELWKISKELFESDAVIFFSSVRWGQANMYYQNLIERLTWIENRHATLGEKNIVKDIQTGMICVGQNWNGENVLETQMKVHEFYGFKVNKKFYWNWQYTKDTLDETQKSYKKSHKVFMDDFDLKESKKK